MPSPLDRLIDAACFCTVCGVAASVGCLCWETRCSCWAEKKAGEKLCQNPHHAADEAARGCICKLPGTHGRECADAQHHTSPCRCACHRGRTKNPEKYPPHRTTGRWWVQRWNGKGSPYDRTRWHVVLGADEERALRRFERPIHLQRGAVRLLRPCGCVARERHWNQPRFW